MTVAVVLPPPPPPQPARIPAIRRVHTPRAGASLLSRPRAAPRYKLKTAIAANKRNPGKYHGLRFPGPGPVSAVVWAVVDTVMTTVVELLVSEGGLKLQEEAAGNPLQLNVTVPAAAVAVTPSANKAGRPAFTVTGAPPEKMARKGLISVLMLTVLFLGSVSPASETVATIELTDRGAFRATSNVTVIAG